MNLIYKNKHGRYYVNINNQQYKYYEYNLPTGFKFEIEMFGLAFYKKGNFFTNNPSGIDIWVLQ